MVEKISIKQVQSMCYSVFPTYSENCFNIKKKMESAGNPIGIPRNPVNFSLRKGKCLTVRN